MRHADPPPPPNLGDPAAERPRGKRPWKKPQLKVMEMEFARNGARSSPNRLEDVPIANPMWGATYRTS